MKAKTYMDAGQLVPDEVIIGIITERLAEADCANGYILDGVPRTIAQAEALEAAGITVRSCRLPRDLRRDHHGAHERTQGLRALRRELPYRWQCPPRAEGVCDDCGGKLVTRKDDEPETVKNTSCGLS